MASRADSGHGRHPMTTWVLLGLLATSPPLVPVDDAPPPEAALQPAPARRAFAVQRPPPALAAPARLAVTFAPMSLFGLALFAEVDVALAGGLDVFAVLGGGIGGQLGFEGGLRYYVLGRSMEGFYVDARASGFSLPASAFLMMSPGLQLGHAWRVKAFALSLGAGFSTWWTVSRGASSSFFFGSPTADQVIVFPGLQVPRGDGPSVQPTLRFALGFAL